MTFSCLSAATSAGMVPRIAVRTACCRFFFRDTYHIFTALNTQRSAGEHEVRMQNRRDPTCSALC